MKKISKKVFTLVELIIVIAIIAILAVTAFLLLTKWLAKARDASRSSNLANIENSLQISITENSSLPKPDSYILIYASGTSNVVGYQGYFGEGVKDAVGNINSAPKDGDDYFTYYLNADLNKYQLAGFMENETAYNPNVVSAIDYSSRYVNVRGDKLGLLTDSNKSPLQSLGMTGLDLLTGTASYVAYMDNSTNVAGTGKQLFTYYYNKTKSLLNNKDLAKNDDSLVGYRDMTTLTGTLLNDFSRYGINGICYSGNTVVPCNGSSGGPQIVGNSMKFDGIDDWVAIPKTIVNNITGTKMTIIVKFKSQKGGDVFGRHLSTSDCQGTIVVHSTGQPQAYMKVGDINYRPQYQANVHGKDTYIGLVYDSQNIFFYYNNEKVSSENALGNIANYVASVYGLGVRANIANLNEFFNGTIDEVRIYNRALSDDEVKALYDATK